VKVLICVGSAGSIKVDLDTDMKTPFLTVIRFCKYNMKLLEYPNENSTKIFHKYHLTNTITFSYSFYRQRFHFSTHRWWL